MSDEWCVPLHIGRSLCRNFRRTSWLAGQSDKVSLAGIVSWKRCDTIQCMYLMRYNSWSGVEVLGIYWMLRVWYEYWLSTLKCDIFELIWFSWFFLIFIERLWTKLMINVVDLISFFYQVISWKEEPSISFFSIFLLFFLIFHIVLD